MEFSSKKDPTEHGLSAKGYALTERVDSGGFGVVYQAIQATTGQVVAVKVVRIPEDRDEVSVARLLSRFSRETKLCATLKHPNIVRVLDAGQTPTGVPYTVFEFVPGRTLKQILRDDGPLEIAEAKFLMLQVLDALACAHEQGIIHRDLKPSNIMVVETGACRNAVVLDFGIGALIPAVGETEHTRLTGTAELLGTPGYAAPEQLRGLDSLRGGGGTWGIRGKLRRSIRFTCATRPFGCSQPTVRSPSGSRWRRAPRHCRSSPRSCS